MKFKLKNYKFLKIKSVIKKNKLLFFYDQIYLNYKNKSLIEKDLKKLKTKYYKIYNSLIFKIIKNSIYKNIKVLINSGIFIAKFSVIKKNFYLKNIQHLNAFSILLGIKLNNKIYSKIQIVKLNNLNFQKNILIFLKKLKLFIKINFYNLLRITKNFSK